MPKKILIVDDDLKNRTLLRILVQHAGYETVEAENGAEAVRLVKELIPDLVLMDIRMPVINGIEATKMIKTNPVTARIPIIALTASAMTGAREIILQAGCDDYMTKPISTRPFLELIKKYLEE